MDDRPDIEITFQRARELSAMGYHLVPLEFGTKTPMVRWKTAPPLSPSDIDVLSADPWMMPNFGIVAGKSGVVVLDCDEPEAVSWVESRCPPTSMSVATPGGGVHYYFAENPEVPLAPKVRAFGIGLDIRAGMSLAVVPESWSSERSRRWRFLSGPVPPSALPILPADPFQGLFRHRIGPLFKPAAVRPRGGAIPIREVTRWIMAVDSIQGSGGSNQCFRVACRLVDAGLSWGESWRWLCRWNRSKAIPPWSEAELWHKLQDALART